MALGIVNMKRTGKPATFSVELADVANVSATASNKVVELTWTDPDDVTVSGGTLAKWAGTLVVRKAGSVPTDHTDGTVVVNSTTKDAYSSTPYRDVNLTNGTTYYYRFFPYTTAGIYTDGTTVSARPAETLVELPSLVADFTYDGTLKTPALTYNSTYVNVSGDESGINAGDYSITFTLLNDNCIWMDGSYEPKTIHWSISKAAGSVAVPNSTVFLTVKNPSSTVAITQVGDGELSVESGNNSLITGVISGNTLTISRIGTSTGTCQMTIKATESNNYTAAQVIFNATVVNYTIMTVKIDQSNSNLETCCSYANDAVDMEPGSADWDEFFGHYPCLLSGGVEGVKLDPNNFDQDVDGSTVTITSGSNDVMVAFPRRGLKISTSGDIVTISMTDNPDDENFEYMAHRRGDTLKDKFYLGVYMGSTVSSKLRSLKGKTIANNKTIGEFRTLARANSPASDGNGGSGYDQHGWYQLVYLQAMYVLKYKNLDSQTTVGTGYVAVDNPAQQKATGGTETKGMDWGETTGTDHMKLFGLEDFWGNVRSWIDGIWSDANRNIWTATQSFNDTGSGYTDRGSSGLTANKSNAWLSRIQGDTHKAFLIGSDSGVSGSSTTYFTDSSSLCASRLLDFGNSWHSSNSAGAFCCHLYYIATFTYADIGSRLMYL